MDPIAELEATMNAEMEANDARIASIEEQLPSALRALLALASGSPEKRYGIAAAEILRAAHRKGGTVETSNLSSLDPENLKAAMIVLEACAHPSMLSDSGLAFDGEGNPRLSDAEVALIA